MLDGQNSGSSPSARGGFGRLGFVFAAAGSAIGLGNIWKFPYVTYSNNGGTFVLVYLGAVLLIGAPIMAAEIMLGRHTQQNPVGAFHKLASTVRGGRAWVAVGWLGIAAGFVILSYYSVVAGWTVYYFGKCVGWSVTGFGIDASAHLAADFGNFLASGGLQVLFHGLFMVATMGVVIFGVKAGIERVTKVLLPVLFALLLVLVIDSIWSGGFRDAIAFLFHVGPMTPEAILEAVGQSFFTLSLGMGAMITYGSYISPDESIPKAVFTVSVLDTLIALMASVVMFSIIFSVPTAERAETFSQSATILFTTLPRMLYGLPGGSIVTPAFYLLVAFAALTSTISLLEVVVAYFIDGLHWGRRKATLVVGTVVFLMGVPSALSLGASDFLSSMDPLGKRAVGFFSTFDYLAANWMLPTGGFFVSVFVGWFLDGALTRRELEAGHGEAARLNQVWRFLLRFVCPLAIAWIMISVIGGKSFS